ncbi:hypothetical protein OIV83_001054 [Microbotryomycetes sp. JL201]|nr:hypothetical protein OIV83_001054 [Microbotryomycetes sp. JL201]
MALAQSSSSISNLETFPTIIVDSRPPVPTSLPSSIIISAANATSSKAFTASTCTQAYCSYSDTSGGVIVISSVAETSSPISSRTSMTVTSPIVTASSQMTSVAPSAPPTSSALRLTLKDSSTNLGLIIVATFALAFTL